MVLKYALKYMCIVAMVLYSTMTLNLMTKLWKLYKRKIDPYQITTLSELDLQSYDIHQIRMLKDSVTEGDDTSEKKTSKLFDTYVRSEERDHNWIQDKKELMKQTNTIDVPIADEDQFKRVGKISVFSAYYDNRAELENPLVRIFGLTSTDLRENLVCGFLGSDKSRWVLAEKYEMCENHGKSYGGYMFNCMLPVHLKIFPKKVYLHTLTSISEQTILNLSMTVALEVKHIRLKHVGIKETHKVIEETNVTLQETGHTLSVNKTIISGNLKIAVCVSPMYGKINLSNLVQFIELLKIQGVCHIVIYKMTVSKSVEILLDYYQSKGDITVVNWTLPSFIQTNQIWYNGQIIMIQDCLYRVMGNYDYVTFLDLDEAIIPRLDFYWSDLIHRLEFLSNRENPSHDIFGFSFKSVYFDPDNQVTNSQKLSFLKSIKRNKIQSQKRTKVIVKPEAVTEMGIHHVSSTIQAYDKDSYTVIDKNVSVVDVDPDIGLIHHFKKCSTQLDPNMNCDKSIEDTNILKYEKLLIKQYNDVLAYNMKYLKTLS